MPRTRKSVYLTLSGLWIANPEMRCMLDKFVERLQEVRLFNTSDDKHVYYHSGLSVLTPKTFCLASDLIDEIEFAFRLSKELTTAKYDNDADLARSKAGKLVYQGRKFKVSEMQRKGSVLEFRLVVDNDDNILKGDDKAIDQGTKKDCCEPRGVLAS